MSSHTPHFVLLARDEHVRVGISYKVIAQAVRNARASTVDWAKRVADLVCDQSFDKLGPVILGEYMWVFQMTALYFECHRQGWIRGKESRRSTSLATLMICKLDDRCTQIVVHR